MKITCTAADNVSVAFYQNAIPIIRELAVENNGDHEANGVSVHLTSEPAFVTPGVWRIDRLANGATENLRVG